MTEITERDARGKSPVLTSSAYIINDGQTTMYQQSATNFNQNDILGSRNSIIDLQKDIRHQQLGKNNSMSMNPDAMM